MKQIQYLVGAVVLVVLDSIYLNIIKKYFSNQIRSIQGTDIQINYMATGLTYVFLIFGLSYFILRKRSSVSDAALLGLTIYAVYEFTNLALFKKWSVFTVLIDTTWGAILFGLTTFIVYKLT